MLAVLFVVLPLVIIIAWLATRDVTPSESSNGSHEVHQNGNDNTASGQTSEDDPRLTQAPPNEEGSDSERPDLALNDIIVFDLESGIMTFIYTPESQTDLEESTIAKIRELLSSPQNTENSIISVEIPQLSDYDTEMLSNTIINAFESLEVSLSVIIFNIYQPDPNIKKYEIVISFQ